VARTRDQWLGPASRPVAIPDDINDPRLPKASGVVVLPRHVRWSGPPRTYDLERLSDRLRVYEQVLREGTEDDVRFYIDVTELQERFHDLVLPPYVREAWAGWFRLHRGVELVC
jgi:hypothetical protein